MRPPSRRRKSGICPASCSERRCGDDSELENLSPQSGHSTVYLQNVVTDPFITVGDHTTYDDFVRDPRDFQRNQVLYHYPECNHDRLIIGKYCSIACGAAFLFNAANHALGSLSTYPFPIFFEEWGTDAGAVADAWDNSRRHRRRKRRLDRL